MNPTPCLNKQSCLAERERELRLDHYRAYTSRCMNCIEGAARQMDGFVPEPGFGPFCVQCGGELPLNEYGGKGNTISGICKECSNRGRTNKGNRKNHGPAYWGYREKAHRIVLHNEAKRKSA